MRVEYVNYSGIYLVGEEDLEVKSRIFEKDTSEGELFINNTNIEGLVTYGLIQKVADAYHDAGYIWSSRPAVMNKNFGLKLIDVVYSKENRSAWRTCAISADYLEELLKGTGWEIDWEPTINDTDVSYRIKKVAI